VRILQSADEQLILEFLPWILRLDLTLGIKLFQFVPEATVPPEKVLGLLGSIFSNNST